MTYLLSSRRCYGAFLAFLSALLLLAAGCGDRSDLLAFGRPDGGSPFDGSTPEGGPRDTGSYPDSCFSDVSCASAGAACGQIPDDCGDFVDCGACPSGEGCGAAGVASQCAPTAACGPTTCPTGCCDAAGDCLSGTTMGACGSSGNACTACAPGSTCDANAHQCLTTMTTCNANTCPNGCCTGSACAVGLNDQTCGIKGQACSNCQASGETCVSPGICEAPPSPVCNPGNCMGCCDGQACVGGFSNQACGVGGEQCFPCPPGTGCGGGFCQGGPPPPNCGPDTCGGCCDSSGNCQGGFDQGACGQNGASCASCDSMSTCQNGFCEVVGCVGTACPCSPFNCDGCCDQNNVCQPGFAPTACGFGGNGCFNCGPMGQCQGGSCQVPSCDNGTCNGCCDQNNTCQPGLSTGSCGSNGSFCQPCPPGNDCQGGFCMTPTCNSQTCPNGCCDAFGTCQSGSSTQACGTAGSFCASCSPGAVCKGGSCAGTCNAMTCPNGCCDATGLCEPGGSLDDCGKGGGACTECPVGAVCQAGGCVGSTCNQTTCPNGCCDGNGICQTGDSLARCGSFGQMCASCSPGAQCDQGQCFNSSCSASSCPQGCCDQNGACQAGNDPNACGSGGAECAECFGASCLAGVCQPTVCNQDTCQNGCCDANGVCQSGFDNGACGSFGQECVACGTGAACSNGACTGFACDASTCPAGCCDASGNCQTGLGATGGSTCPCALACQGCCDAMDACHAGTISTACGSNGASCQNCASSGLTCDTNLFPVMCDQSCPSPYPGCAPGLTDPPQPAPVGACKMTDLNDAAMGCVAGPDSNDCQNFINGEFGVNQPCANCLDQFLFDFSTRTGIYLCAAPFVSGTCDVAAGCAQDCQNQGCQQCVEQSCDATAQAGECSQFFGPADQCIASSMAATALCAEASYPNFGAWLQGVGKHYCR